MPNLNNFERMLAGSPTKKTPTPTRASPNIIDNILGGSPPKKASSSKGSPTFNFASLLTNNNIRRLQGGGYDGLFTPAPVRKVARKVAPRVRPMRKQAPTPKPRVVAPPVGRTERVASPDVKFSHKFDGTNSGERDARGRIIYHGKRGGKYVISSIGKRVPHVEKALKNKKNKGDLDFTGKLDRKGRKIYKGKRGGEFVISESGKRLNPIM